MSNGWDLEKSNDGSGEKKEFAKFPEGVTEIRIFDSAPHQRWSHWLPLFTRSVNCPGRGCPICDINKRARDNGDKNIYGNQKKFAMNIYNQSMNQLQIMDEGKLFMEDLRDVKDEIEKDGKPLIGAILKVRKRGTGRDTTYRIDLKEHADLTKEEKEAFNDIVDLDEYYKKTPADKILELLAIDEQDKDKRLEMFNEILYGPKEDTSNDSEDIATEETEEVGTGV